MTLLSLFWSQGLLAMCSTASCRVLCVTRCRLLPAREEKTDCLWLRLAWTCSFAKSRLAPRYSATNLPKTIAFANFLHKTHRGRKKKGRKGDSSAVSIMFCTFISSHVFKRTDWLFFFFFWEQSSVCSYLTLRCIRLYSFRYVHKWYWVKIEGSQYFGDHCQKMPWVLWLVS